MKTSVALGAGGVALAIGLFGCGSEKSSDMGHWEAKEGSNYVGNEDSAPERLSGDQDVTQKVQPVGFNWAGVRHDLAINPNRARAANCTCLSVEVGTPEESKFVWRGARPEIISTNLALAISALGIDCPGGATNPGDRRPSIAGVSHVNGDVVVDVEEISADRPIATGAIIEPPDVNGKIYIRPRNKKLPYARPSGGNLCRVR